MRSRRTDYSESTKEALVDSAIDLFTKNGYASTSLDAIVKRARVTKGALYHHFSGKQALFEAAFNKVSSRASAQLNKSVEGEGAPWERALEGVQEFIKVCLDPTYQRLVIREAPIAMGFERWREAEEQYSYGIVRSMLDQLIGEGELGDVPLEATARMMHASLAAGAQIIAEASDPKKASAEVFTVLIHMIDGIRRDH
ncbi:TetR/AcrR family transcriptional regulator [Kibdelosporangium phytohabitans]|uniref:TetR family transcriptional regulator n=1 Tax=Kibdelosporangium phytohabitans TaxID=860235 RepID=A0A0N7F364_9PSEU|nr:TetR/AcrR family transcriptional regulator [Kibdelosporangium phytohabitans]ALG07759.1 TetR family transcriptional regulator [Kibdelosporangium phytohabitans]